jgi:hypothetical protein
MSAAIVRGPWPVPGAALAVTRRLEVTENTAPTAWTHGWDTVFAIRIADANARFAQPGVCPAEFSLAGKNWTAEGTFGPWRIATGGDGGSGTIVLLSLPVTGGTLTYAGTNYALAPSRFLISVQLGFLASKTVTLPSGTRTELVFHAKNKDVPAVVVTDYDHPNDDVQLLLRGAMQDWLNEQLPLIEHVFASADIDVQVTGGNMQWLAPTYTSYAIHSGADEESSFLAVLGLCQGRDAAGLTEQISAASIPVGSRAGLLIAPELFFRNMLEPSMAASFTGMVPGTLTVDVTVDGPVLSNRSEVALDSFEHEGKTYHPVLQNVSVTVNAGEIVMQSVTRIPISPGIRGYVKQTSHHVLKLVDKPGGGKTLQLVDSQPAESNHWQEIDPGVQVAEWIVAAAGVIAGIALSSVSGGLSLALGTMLVGVLTGLAAGTPDIIASVLGQELSAAAPSVDGLVFGATNFINWPGGQVFTLDSAGFASSLQLGGNPNFQTA